ncbi:MAG: nucleoside triphosphate pyrophosphohydrolase [Chloroflexi bacterium]|nr:nucleoside triphosphate pyrophosphohydrolase [Chloroflexota bacterium]
MTEQLFSGLRCYGVRAADGIQIVSASALVRRPIDPGWPLLLVPDETFVEAAGAGANPSASAGASPDATPAESLDARADHRRGDGGFTADVLPGRHARRADPLAILRALYPSEHPVRAREAPDDKAARTIASLSADDLAAQPWLIPALEGESNVASPHGLPWLAARLRAPDGCPWDREQTHLSLRKHLLEEAYEVYDTLEEGATPQLAEELGDLLLQVVLHAQYAAEAGVFDLSDVYRGIMTKIVRRHPHVFGDVEAGSVEQVVRNWESIKADERAVRAASDGSAVGVGGSEGAAAFSGLSRSLPALAYAYEMQERAASLGYDWPDLEGVIDKLAEEAVELLQAPDEGSRREEYGDLLLVLVNLGRKLGIDAEGALRSASAKFSRRFAYVERLAAERNVSLGTLSLAGLDDLWQEAKAQVPEDRAQLPGAAKSPVGSTS